jgi:hypothetical protein
VRSDWGDGAMVCSREISRFELRQVLEFEVLSLFSSVRGSEQDGDFVVYLKKAIGAKEAAI